ncbi:DUF305 domain-containing protein [Alkalinema pantanalense CENA528]|uniref:DUF305 domain-containing protein n=1 Tax=Alkalinema pantanalense TaxID=1620705 RepID=UPI003D6F8FB6
MRMQVSINPQLFLIAIVSTVSLTGCPSTPPTLSEVSASSTPSVTMTPMPMSHTMMGHSMDLGPADAEFDLRFIDAMIPHHQGAVDMAQAVLAKSQRPELKKLAQGIIAAQNPEIQQMQRWRADWYPKAPKAPIAWHGEMKHSMPMSQEQIHGMKMTMDLGKADPQFDLRFLNAMIVHHEAAVTMAQEVLEKSKRPEMQKLAKAIVSGQTNEIELMQQWRKRWYSQ